MANLNLDSLLAAARAAKQEAGSGEWLVGPAFTRHSQGRTWTAHDVGTVGRVQVAENCHVAVAAHITVADPDTVIALVERLQRAEAERDQAQASLDYIEERDARVLRDLFDECAALRDAHADAAEVLEQVAAERDRADDLAEDLGAELDHLQVDIEEHLPEYRCDDGCGGTEPANHRETVEYAGHEIRRLRAGLAARDAALDACAARIAELLAAAAALEARRDKLLALVSDLSQRTPLPSELEGWEGQRAALLAVVGTLRSGLAEAERARDAGRDIAIADSATGTREDRAAAWDRAMAAFLAVRTDRDDMRARHASFLARLAAALGWEPGRSDFDEDDIVAAVEHREEARKERDALSEAEAEADELRAAIDIQTDLAVTLLEDAHERRLLLEHVRDELRRLATAHPGPRVDLELLAVQVDVGAGWDESRQALTEAGITERA